MWLFCFSPVLSTGGKLQAELDAGSFDASGEGSSRPGVQISVCAAWLAQGQVFFFLPTSVPQAMGTKAVSGAVSGQLLCPSASVVLPLCYLMSPTACTCEAARLPSCCPSPPGAPRPLPDSPHLLLTILLAPHKPLSPLFSISDSSNPILIPSVLPAPRSACVAARASLC